MKWLSAANSYPLSSGKKAFYVTKSPHAQEIGGADHLVEAPHPFGLYSVTRVNPLYVDEANGVESECESESKLPVDENGGSCGERDHCKTDYLYSNNPLRQNAPAVVKQNADFIRSILFSVRLAHHKQQQQHCHSNDLTPIPEGRTDSLSHAATQQQLAQNSSSPQQHQNGVHVEKLSRYKHKRWKGTERDSDDVLVVERQRTLLEILRELSSSINNAMENADQVEIPPEAVLRSLREKINHCLESGAFSPDGGGRCGGALKEDAVVTLSRAFSFVNSFNHGSQDGLDGGRLLLLKRLGRFSGGGEPFYEHVRHSSSSSASSNTSTSGFSDLTHTPASSNASASDSPPISRTDGMQLAPDGLDRTDVVRCNDNIIIDSNKNNDNNHNVDDNNGNNINNNNLNNDNRSNSGNRNHHRHNYVIKCDTAKDALAFKPFEYNAMENEANFNIARSVFGVTVKDADNKLQTAIYTKSDSLLSSYPGRRCPDFTLDVQQAEMVMKKVNERKKERCYCRMVTSFVGFAFLLFSVMFFSMMLTRGEKMFGSL